MGFGEYPAEYNPKIHGPYDPARFYGKGKWRRVLKLRCGGVEELTWPRYVLKGNSSACPDQLMLPSPNFEVAKIVYLFILVCFIHLVCIIYLFMYASLSFIYLLQFTIYMFQSFIYFSPIF